MVDLVINGHISLRDPCGLHTVAVRHRTRSALISFANRATIFGLLGSRLHRISLNILFK